MTSASLRVDVLGVGVSAISLRGALSEIERWVQGGEHHYVCVTGVHGVIESQRDAELREIHNRSGLTVADGMPVFWSGRVAGSRDIERMRGSDFMLALCELAARHGWRNYFYGGAPGTPELLAERLRSRFPTLQVAGLYSPPFRQLSEEENDAIVAEINGSGADLVWIGLSTPKQERWMAANVGRLGAAALLGVGMAFDVHAGLLPQAPRVIQNSGFEWLYRLWNEPRRLWRRYLYANPKFLVGVARRRPYLRREDREPIGDCAQGGDGLGP
jgi:N-acetylglucosaminyldiphosphoundecaprenol N-acetyl-beta-D-mannosaminyltransferase